MKSTTSIFIIVALLATGSVAQDKTSRNDQALIEQVIENWNKAWQAKDAKLAAQDYCCAWS